MTDLGDRAILIIGQAIDHHCGSTRAVSLVADLLVVGSIEVAGTALDCPIDIVLGHALRFGFIDGEPQPRIGGQVPAASTRGNCDFANQLGKELTALLVLSALAVLDVRPLTVSCHIP